MTDAEQKTLFAWEPQPGPQTALLKCGYKEILFGGSRGGGVRPLGLG
jgi:hypothetical protein